MPIEYAFFITYMPRSGSQWLTKLLDCNTSGVQVRHLNIKSFPDGDIKYNEDAYYGRIDEVRNYLLGSRTSIIQEIGAERAEKLWGDVCERHRYAVPLIRELYPNKPIVGLIRNGRQSVVSLTRRGFHRGNPRDLPFLSSIKPFDDETKANWKDMTPFEKCCWEWADAYRRLVEQKVPIYRLEDLNADYSHLQQLCEFLGVEVTEREWEKRSGVPIDPHRSPTPLTLSPENEELFQHLAGDIQERFYGRDS